MLPSWIDCLPDVSPAEIAAAGPNGGPQGASVRAMIEALPPEMVVAGVDPSSDVVGSLVDATDPFLPRPSRSWVADSCARLCDEMSWSIPTMASAGS